MRYVALSNLVIDRSLRPYVLVRDLNCGGVLFLHNGVKVGVGEYAVEVGDFIWVANNCMTPHRGYIEIQGTNYTSSLNIATQNPDSYEEFPIFKRPPREIHREPTDTVNLTAPQDKEEPKKGELLKMLIPPLMSAGMMVGVGLLIGRGMMMFMSVGMMVVAVSRAIFMLDNINLSRVEFMGTLGSFNLRAFENSPNDMVVINGPSGLTG